MARILVIDDDDQFRNLICTQLKRAGYMVMDASDGFLGLEMQRSVNADLIITDIFICKSTPIPPFPALLTLYFTVFPFFN